MFNTCFLQKEISARTEEIIFFESLSRLDFIKSAVVFTDSCRININAPVLHSYYLRHLFYPKIIFVADKNPNHNYNMYKHYGKLLSIRDVFDLENIEDFLRNNYYEYTV